MPFASSLMLPRPAVRMLLGLCALVLLVGGPGAADAEALTPLGSQISSGRRSQAYFESVMRAQDAVIAATKAQAKVTRKAIRQARRWARHAWAVYRTRAALERQRRARLAEVEALHAETPAEEIPEAYFDRLRSLRQGVAKATRQRQAAARDFRAAKRAGKARRYRLSALKRQRRAAVARRESAEGGLGAHIVRMTQLAHQRAELVSRSSVGATSFTWPAVGRLSQTYGCTGFRLNPPRGSCRHFHDGLDLVAGYGSPVRTAADGVVAYAGWNPWDEGGRAWIMVVSHPNGYVTRYGHLVPGGKARVGRVVRRGQVIGRMGNTGKSTGTHLHFELLRGNTPLSPWGYLPEGMVEPKVKRSPDRKRAKAGQRRHASGRGKRARRAQERRQRQAERRESSNEAAQPDDGSVASLRALADTTTAIFESGLDDATLMMCLVIERSRGGADPAAAGPEVREDPGGSHPGDARVTADGLPLADEDPCTTVVEEAGAEADGASPSGQGPPITLGSQGGGAAGTLPRPAPSPRPA